MRPKWWISLIVLVVILLALGSVTAQDDLILDMQTVEAAVQARFTATADAQVNSTLALTIDAMFAQALTATAENTTPSPTPTVTNYPLTLTAQTTWTTRATLTAQPTSTQAPQDIEALQGLGSALIAIGGGTFQMGTTAQEVAVAVRECVEGQGGNCRLEMGADSVPTHDVILSPYFMEWTEVTYGQYVAFLNLLGPNSHLNGCAGQPCAVTRDESENSNLVLEDGTYGVLGVIGYLPAAGVTWYGAQAYCEAIGRRLPTEAEWEFAARGVTGYVYPWGNQWDAAFAKTSIPVTGEIGALPVGSYRNGASMFGLRDMAGNVAEWVQDWYDPSYYQQPEASGEDPTGAAAGVEKVIRGGSWDAKPFFARSVHRQSREPHTSGAWLGFRRAADKTDQIMLTVSPAPTRTPVLATPTASK